VGAECGGADQNLAAERATPVKFAANPRAILVDGATARHRIQGDARAIAGLVHEASAVILRHEFLGDKVHVGFQFDEQVAATGAADAGRYIRVWIRRNGPRGAGLRLAGEHYWLEILCAGTKWFRVES